MQTEALKRLFDAFTAIESIERFIANCTLDHYLDNELIQSAVERKFEIIGEALKRASEADPMKDTKARGRWRGEISVPAGAGDPGGVVTRLLLGIKVALAV